MKFKLGLIKDLRLRNQYTQTYLANQLGISQGTYRQYEEGTVAVSIDRLMDIAQGLFRLSIRTFS